MIDVNINFDLNEYLTNVVNTFKEKLTNIETVRAYSLYGNEIRDIPTPAILIDLTEILPTDMEQDSSTGQKAIYLNMSAFIILGCNEQQVELKLRQQAINVANLIHKNKFNSDVGPGEIAIISQRPEVHDENDMYMCWGVDWTHMTYIASQDLSELIDDPPVDAAEICDVYMNSERVYPMEYSTVFDFSEYVQFTNFATFQGLSETVWTFATIGNNKVMLFRNISELDSRRLDLLAPCTEITIKDDRNNIVQTVETTDSYGRGMLLISDYDTSGLTDGTTYTISYEQP